MDRRRFVLTALPLLLLAAAPVRAYSSDELSLGYLEGYATDAGQMLASPLHWDGEDWLTAGIVAGGTYGLTTIDAAVRDAAQRNQAKVGTRVQDVAVDFGNGYYVAPALAAVYVYGHFDDDDRARRVGLYGMESFALSGLFGTIIKDMAGRARPYTGESPGTWLGFRTETSETSFPSGHAQTAFAWATVVATEYSEAPAVPYIAYGIGGAVMWARVYGNYHWTSDVFFGAALGYFTAKAVLRYHEAERKVTLLPFTDGRAYGLAGDYRF